MLRMSSNLKKRQMHFDRRGCFPLPNQNQTLNQCLSGRDSIGFTSLRQENLTRLGFSLNTKSKSLQMSRKRLSEGNFELILTILAPISQNSQIY